MNSLIQLRHSRAARVIGIALLVFSSNPVIAQSAAPTATTPVNEVVVTATKNEQKVRDAIAHTTVLTQKEIRDSQSADLASLLRREAGFEMSQNGGLGSVTSLFMRGGRGNQTLVLVDGVRIQDAAFGSTALQHIMLAEVERIEIVRGNVSSVHGAGAIGGVIQIFTKQGRGPLAVNAQATLGSRGTAAASGGVSGAVNEGATRFSLALSGYKTTGFSAIDATRAAAANPDDDAYKNTSAALSLSHHINAAHEIGGRLYAARGKADYDSSFGLRTDRNAQAQNLGAASAFWNARFTDAWRSTLTFSEGTDRAADSLNSNVTSRSKTRNQELGWSNRVALNPHHTLSGGYDFLRQNLTNSFLVSDRTRTNHAWRAGYEGRIERHALQANLRAERYSDFGRATTGFLGYGHDLTDAWRLTASVSNAFRAPTFFDLYGFGGDPLLKPERSRSWEAGVQYAGAPGLLRAVWFNTKYQDAITFNVGRVRNTRNAENHGLELSYAGTLAGVDLRAALTLQDPVEQEPGAVALQGVRRAKAYGSFSAHKSFGALRVGGEFQASGQRPDTDINLFTRKMLGSYEVFNLLARYDLAKNVYVTAKLENAFNRKYQLVDGYNTTPRGLFFTLGWKPE